MIRFEDVVIRYRGAPSPAVQGVSLESPAGRITAVVGPNGSGKSTLVRALLGRIPLERGSIALDGTTLADLERRAIATVMAVVPQREEPVFPLAVRDYIALGRHPHGGPFAGRAVADREAIDRAIVRADVAAFTERRTDELSGGEWQRVRIARALAQGGRALVLDEPTTFLDVAHEMAVFELLDALARAGQAVLLVSHQLNLVARFADHIVLMHRGRVAADGTPADVMRGEVLERVYEWPLVVSRDPAVGAPVLVPLRGRGTR
ncbi:MAG: ABC transporter ATP-binding protein [Gemmatimonadaceae bacterium]|nr:ABC transporter ATP-binding protein [Gemmatimonadaceae bacterium]MCW5825011.1 ABC transporter ATP-binding protein [Gemmatimonadaceae bacterium]